LSKIRAIETLSIGEETRMPEIPRDLREIELTIRRMDARLVIIDPLMAYLGSQTNSWRDQDVRRALAPVGKLAERTGAAIVVIRHLNKGGSAGSPLYRGGGSIGIIGAARSALLVGEDPDDPDVRILARSKGNLSAPVPSLAYRLEAADRN